MMRRTATALSGLIVAGLAACGPSARVDGEFDAAPGETPDASIGAISDAFPVEPEAIVYAHDSSTLFSLNPTTLDVTVIGPMTGCSGIVDIAVNADGEIFGSGSANGGSGIVSIDSTTGACSLRVAGAFSNALSFVPVGVLDPTKEMLVSYGDADGSYQYVSIDPDTGDVVGIGAPPNGYGSSGDIVSVEGGGTYWSAYGPCNDCLVELNPTTGAMIHDWGAIGASGVWGLAFWGGIVYGFTSSGQIVRLTFGADTITSEVVANTAYSFYGAGSTTKAPLVID